MSMTGSRAITLLELPFTLMNRPLYCAPVGRPDKYTLTRASQSPVAFQMIDDDPCLLLNGIMRRKPAFTLRFLVLAIHRFLAIPNSLFGFAGVFCLAHLMPFRHVHTAGLLTGPRDPRPVNPRPLEQAYYPAAEHDA